MNRLEALSVALVATLLAAFGVVATWTFTPKAIVPLKWSIRWSFFSSRYKKQVLALSPSADGYLGHVEWDSWGFAGVAETEVYLVRDSSNRLAAAAASGQPGKFPGLPCEVYQVREFDSNWYAVWFYSDTDWESCVKKAAVPPASGS